MAAESELIEREALADLHEAASAELRAELRLKLVRLGSALVSVAGALPPSAITINRALGLGLESAETEGTITELLDTYRGAGVGRYFIQRHPKARPPALVGWLLAAGLEKTRGWQKFRRGREPVPRLETDLRIDEIGAERGPEFGRIVSDAFDLGEVAGPWLACLAGRPRWHLFMSFDGGVPAGAGALYVRDDLGWTDLGATVPSYRRRGSQAALLACRIEHALELGCREIHCCTGEEVPGDPQHSYRNILKAGFEETYVRENFAPPKR